jgi:transcriptional regulator with XRE-family HTH domain
MHLGLKIKFARMVKGITQAELAEKINKTRALVSHIEQSGQVNYFTLSAIATALEVNFDDVAPDMINEPTAAYKISRKKKEFSFNDLPNINSNDNKMAVADNRIKALEEEVAFLKKVMQAQLDTIDILKRQLEGR